MKTITDIEKHALAFKAARDLLKSRIEDCQHEQGKILNLRRGGIRSAADRTRDAKAELIAAIEQNPHLFQKPRTQTVSGIKFGYAKGKGRIETIDNTVSLIRRHLPDQADKLINTRESVNKTAVGNLPTALLKKIGCTVTDSGDQVLITVPKDNLDKLVDSMLQDVEEGN